MSLSSFGASIRRFFAGRGQQPVNEPELVSNAETAKKTVVTELHEVDSQMPQTTTARITDKTEEVTDGRIVSAAFDPPMMNVNVDPAATASVTSNGGLDDVIGQS